MEEKQKNKDLENALQELTKLLKAVKYYPPGHPSLKASISHALQAFTPLIKRDKKFVFSVQKEGFLLEGTAIATRNPILKKLAPFLFARRIRHIMVLKDLTGEDLKAFARCLTLEPPEIEEMGGIQEVLLKARVSTIWVNEIDLSEILAQKHEIDEEKRAHPAREGEGEPSGGTSDAWAHGEKRDLEKVLRELQKEKSAQRYRLLLQELIPLIRLNLNQSGRHLALKALVLLCNNTANKNLDYERREHSRNALEELETDDVLDFLVGFLCTRGLPDNVRETLLGVLVFLKEKVVGRLMDHLAEESDQQARKFLIEALIRQGSVAVPILARYLSDERWFVVRNAANVLGEIRDQKTSEQLTPLLQHEDVRVRREAVRALTRIGGEQAVGILLNTLEGDDPDLCNQALLSLGAMKHPAAVPTLLKLVTKSDPMVKNAEVKKGAIKALGEIGSEEAVPALMQILKHRKIWRRSHNDEIRAAAAAALGGIGSPTATETLTSATDDNSPAVARAAVQALKQLRKRKEHEPGTP